MKKVVISGVNSYKLPVLSQKEMDSLFKRLENKDAKAREELVQGNLRLVLSVLQRFQNRGEAMDDLFQVGCIGLLKAIDNFDIGHEVHFSTYAVPMIIGEIKRYLRDNNAIRVSRSTMALAYKAQQVKEKLLKENFREPTVEEIAAVMEIPPEEVAFVVNAAIERISLYDPVFSDSTDPIYILDIIADEKNHGEGWADKLNMKEALNRVKTREKQILEARFFEGKTQMEIAKELKISQAQVSRIEKGALLKVRNYLCREEGTGVRKNA